MLEEIVLHVPQEGHLNFWLQQMLLNLLLHLVHNKLIQHMSLTLIHQWMTLNMITISTATS